MKSRLEQDDERNGSFEPASLPLQPVKPGIEIVKGGKETEEGGHTRITPSDAAEIPQGGLAERIRNQERK